MQVESIKVPFNQMHPLTLPEHFAESFSQNKSPPRLQLELFSAADFHIQKNQS
jgi:hypothetical protein